MGKYAANTEVSQEKSRVEIETTLMRYGANAFSYGWSGTKAVIAFQAHERQIRFELEVPDRRSEEFTSYRRKGSPYLYDRSESEALRLWEKACRQRWRALALVVKAKLEAVDSGISEFEEEFLAHIVLPDGTTVGARALPEIEKAYQDGGMPKTLLLTAGV